MKYSILSFADTEHIIKRTKKMSLYKLICLRFLNEKWQLLGVSCLCLIKPGSGSTKQPRVHDKWVCEMEALIDSRMFRLLIKILYVSKGLSSKQCASVFRIVQSQPPYRISNFSLELFLHYIDK